MIDPRAIAVSIPIFTTVGVFTMIILLRRYRNMERMAMIERGMNPADLKADFRRLNRRQHDPYRAMRIACAVIGVGVGLFVGNILRAVAFDRVCRAKNGVERVANIRCYEVVIHSCHRLFL